jgi:hypothetical protein
MLHIKDIYDMLSGQKKKIIIPKGFFFTFKETLLIY